MASGADGDMGRDRHGALVPPDMWATISSVVDGERADFSADFAHARSGPRFARYCREGEEFAAVSFSSDLFYLNVLRSHEPDHILLPGGAADRATGLCSTCGACRICWCASRQTRFL